VDFLIRVIQCVRQEPGDVVDDLNRAGISTFFASA
jgi:hypothetical protein